jgi:hypothetical protein
VLSHAAAARHFPEELQLAHCPCLPGGSTGRLSLLSGS